MDAPRFSTIQNDYDEAEHALRSQPNPLSRQLEWLIGFVRRQYLVVAVITVLVTALGVARLVNTPPTYTAHAKLMIDNSRTRALQQQVPSIYLPMIDITGILTQVELLSSDSIALSVIKSQRLTGNSAFVGTTTKPDTRSEAELIRAALGTVNAQRQVTRVGDTYVLDVSYAAGNPNLAAKMANAFADAYIDDQLDAKYQSSRRANKWLEARIRDLRSQAAAADRAVLDYKRKNKIVDIGGGIANSSPRLLDDERVVQLNTQLSSVRGDEADAQARLERINEIMKQDVPDAGTVDSLKSSVIGRLRSQYLDIAARERIFAAKYGANHLAVVNLRTQMVELRRSMHDELNRIAQSYKSDYEIAKARVQTLQKNLAGLISKAQLINRDRIGLSDLETTAKIYHSLYDNFLNRYMEAAQQQSFPITEARVISRAEQGYRSGPNVNKTVVAAVFLGLIMGFAAGFLRETLDRVFRTRHQVEEILRTNCLAVLPRLPKSITLAQNASNENTQGVPEQISGKKLVNEDSAYFGWVLEEPRSLFAEGLRSIKVAADIASAIKENKIIGVTSSVPREGKSTVASNIAQLMAHAGKRVILLDGDLRNQTLSRNLGRGQTAGLLEVLSGQIDLQQALHIDRRSNLAFLPAVVDSRLAHTDEILSSASFRQLLGALRRDYDYIIVDLPPLAPVSDARATAGSIDSYLYVVEWGRTKINVVQHQLSAAPELYGRLLGVVLSKANLKTLKQYEQYGRGYYKYYDDRYGYRGYS